MASEAGNQGMGRLAPGSVVADRYVIDDYLASGGFATVYRAHHHQIGRKMAIKVLEPPPRHVASDVFQQRFLQEAQLAARIEHPGVVDVFDFGVLDDGRTFLAMDLLSGYDLQTQLERHGAMQASRLVPMFVECLAALAEGHRQGIVHKDLKPSNLFLVKPEQPSERIVILDFGIARVFEDPDARITQDGGFSGTPAYLAPEYIRYQLVTPALDVYQMGLILIELLVGAPAVYSETSTGYLLAHCTQPVLLPKALGDTALGDVCYRAIAKDPDQRYPDAGAFREALLSVPRQVLDTTTEFVKPVLPSTPSESAQTLQMLSMAPGTLESIRGASRWSDNQISTPSLEDERSAKRGWPLVLGAFVVAVLIAAAAVALLRMLQVESDPAPPEAAVMKAPAADPTPVPAPIAAPAPLNDAGAEDQQMEAAQVKPDLGSTNVGDEDQEQPAKTPKAAPEPKKHAPPKRAERSPREPKKARKPEPAPMLLSP